VRNRQGASIAIESARIHGHLLERWCPNFRFLPRVRVPPTRPPDLTGLSPFTRVLTRPEDDSARIIDSISSEAYRRDVSGEGESAAGEGERNTDFANFEGFLEFRRERSKSEDKVNVDSGNFPTRPTRPGIADRLVDHLARFGHFRFNRGYDLEESASDDRLPVPRAKPKTKHR